MHKNNCVGKIIAINKLFPISKTAKQNAKTNFSTPRDLSFITERKAAEKTLSGSTDVGVIS